MPAEAKPFASKTGGSWPLGGVRRPRPTPSDSVFFAGLKSGRQGRQGPPDGFARIGSAGLAGKSGTDHGLLAGKSINRGLSPIVVLEFHNTSE